MVVAATRRGAFSLAGGCLRKFKLMWLEVYVWNSELHAVRGLKKSKRSQKVKGCEGRM